jgi:hypothetical protein
VPAAVRRRSRRWRHGTATAATPCAGRSRYAGGWGLYCRMVTEGQQWERNIYCPASPSRGGLPGLAGVTTRPAGNPSGGVPPAVERELHLHHTPSRVPQRWGTTSCREGAPLTPHAQPGTPAVGYHQLSRGSSTYTTRPAGYPSGGVPPAVERELHLLTAQPTAAAATC